MPKGYYTPKGFTPEELESLEEITFKNMVMFYHDELNRVLNGELGTKVLTKGDRRRLEITLKAQELLKEIND
jgi:hypothetical protein